MADAKSPPPQDEHGWSIWVAVAFVLLSLVIAPLLVWAMGVFEWRADLGLGMLEFGMLAMAVSAYRVGRRQTALATAIAGLGLVQNAWTGFCGGNWLLGIDSTDSCTR